MSKPFYPYLRRHVIQRSNTWKLSSLLEVNRESKVCQANVPIWHKKEIFWLEVTVDNMLQMNNAYEGDSPTLICPVLLLTELTQAKSCGQNWTHASIQVKVSALYCQLCSISKLMVTRQGSKYIFRCLLALSFQVPLKSLAFTLT